MAMADIRHRVGIAASQQQVYEAVATREGLARWWTHDVRGDAGPGGKLEFFFGYPDPAAVMEVTEQVPSRRVAWRCVAGPDEWVGTDLTFDVKTADDETVVVFSHAGWREPAEFMHHCSTKWAYHLLGLKAGLEGRGYTAHPDDLKISSWG
jgi:uncharacterized protein YndB with AHSA1/START domain